MLWQRVTLFSAVMTLCLSGAMYAQKEPVPEQPDLRRYLLTAPQVLFTLRWGHRADEFDGPPLEPESGHGFIRLHIGADGSIYFLDSGGVQRFDRKGRLLMNARLEETEGSIRVDPKGRIFIYHFQPGKEQLLMYDADGRRNKQVEPLLKRLLDSAVALSNDRVLPLGLGLKCLPDGKIIVGEGYRIDVEKGTVDKVPEDGYGYPFVNLHRGYLYQDAHQETRDAPHWYVYHTGEVRYSEHDWCEVLYRTVAVYDDRGRLLRQVRLPDGERSEVEKQVSFQANLLAVDGRGHFYISGFPRVVYNVPFARSYFQRYIAILEYTPTGRFVGLRAICQVFGDFNITVDKEGNVYWFEPYEEGIRVMMAPVAR